METLQRTANRGSISTGFDIDNSLKFESDNSEELQRNVSSSGSRQTATVSMWIKRTELGVAQYLFTYGNTDNDNGRTFARFQADDTLWIAGGNTLWRGTARVFRDTSAWMHIVIAFDTTQSTANDRFKLYINGVQETSFLTINNPSQNDILGLNFQKQVIGYNSVDGGSYFNGYMAEIVHQDGTASAPTEFGETDSDTGIWIPKDVSGVASGTNGFYLDFEDASNLGNDVSGGTDFTLNNITSADQATDTPTNNFATLNVLNRNAGGSNTGNQNNSIFTEGNTKITGNLPGYWQSGVSTIGITSGKWYFEAKAYDSNTYISTIGYGDEGDIENWGRNNYFPGAAGSKSYGYAGGVAAGYGQIIPSTNQPSPAVPYNQTNIIGVAIDADNGYVYWSKDGTYINGGNPASGASGTGGIAVPTGTGTNGTLLPAVGFYYHTTIPAMVVNFGGYTQFTISTPASDENGYGNFEYAPPSGYYALCTKNLAEYG
ncbi:hypothetical protein N9Y18_06435 [Litoricolaceae bacterium]|nr:hypothetical protein [Litorivicinaceae bacterium]